MRLRIVLRHRPTWPSYTVFTLRLINQHKLSLLLNVLKVLILQVWLIIRLIALVLSHTFLLVSIQILLRLDLLWYIFMIPVFIRIIDFNPWKISVSRNHRFIDELRQLHTAVWHWYWVVSLVKTTCVCNCSLQRLSYRALIVSEVDIGYLHHVLSVVEWSPGLMMHWQALMEKRGLYRGIDRHYLILDLVARCLDFRLSFFFLYGLDQLATCQLRDWLRERLSEANILADESGLWVLLDLEILGELAHFPDATVDDLEAFDVGVQVERTLTGLVSLESLEGGIVRWVGGMIFWVVAVDGPVDAWEVVFDFFEGLRVQSLEKLICTLCNNFLLWKPLLYTCPLPLTLLLQWLLPFNTTPLALQPSIALPPTSILLLPALPLVFNLWQLHFWSCELKIGAALVQRLEMSGVAVSLATLEGLF